MSHWSYMAMLGFTIAASWWLEFFFRIRVLRRPRLLLSSIVPVAIFFLVWDGFAINQGHWTFDPEQILGIFGVGGIPLEEYLFFLIIPIAVILTLEGVKQILKKAHR
jgi:lycopene cyclase domain-containing protein